MILDELGTCNVKDFSSLVYNLFGGQGKAAMDASRNLKAPRSWRLQALSTAEIPARLKLEEDRKQARTGQLIRLMDVPIVEPGIIANPGKLTAAKFAQQLKTAASKFYGSAGPAFVKALIHDYCLVETADTLIPSMLKVAEETLAIEGLRPEAERAIQRFALVQVAGHLGIECEILPFDYDEVSEAVRMVRDAWLSENTLLSDVQRGVEAVKAFILRHGNRFCPSGQSPLDAGIRDAVGYKKEDLYLFTPDGFKEACAGFDPRAIAKEIREQGHLFVNDPGRVLSKHTISGLNAKRLKCYAVKSALLEGEETEGTGGTDEATPDSEGISSVSLTTSTHGTAGTPCPLVPPSPLQPGHVKTIDNIGSAPFVPSVPFISGQTTVRSATPHV